MLSVAGNNHRRARCRTRRFGLLLPLDLVASSQDDGAILGLFSTIGRSKADNGIQSQHGTPAVTGRWCNGDARSPGICASRLAFV